jgi:hypothetical protein
MVPTGKIARNNKSGLGEARRRPPRLSDFMPMKRQRLRVRLTIPQATDTYFLQWRPSTRPSESPHKRTPLLGLVFVKPDWHGLFVCLRNSRDLYSVRVFKRERNMKKWTVPAPVAVAVGILSLSILGAIFTTSALADRMNGKGNCSGGNCMVKANQGGGGVPCPTGTCSKMGTSIAKDVKYCSAANCKK